MHLIYIFQHLWMTSRHCSWDPVEKRSVRTLPSTSSCVLGAGSWLWYEPLLFERFQCWRVGRGRPPLSGTQGGRPRPHVSSFPGGTDCLSASEVTGVQRLSCICQIRPRDIRSDFARRPTSSPVLWLHSALAPWIVYKVFLALVQ